MAIAAKIPAIATTISSSVRVKPEESRLAFISSLPLAGGGFVAGTIQCQRAIIGLLAAGRGGGDGKRRRRSSRSIDCNGVVLADIGGSCHAERGERSRIVRIRA